MPEPQSFNRPPVPSALLPLPTSEEKDAAQRPAEGFNLWHQEVTSVAAWEGVPDSFVAIASRMPAARSSEPSQPQTRTSTLSDASSKSDRLNSNRDEQALRAHPQSDSRVGWRLMQELSERRGVRVWSAVAPGQQTFAEARYIIKQAVPGSQLGHRLVMREIAVLSSVPIPGVVTLLDARVWGDAPFLALPWLPTLFGQQRHRRPAPSSQFARILCVARQAAEALMGLHARGWIHGDLVPRHVAVTDDLQVTLFDLGLARAIQDSPVFDQDVWRGCVTGSLETLAPEAFDEAAPVRPERDCYALGATIAWWLGGRWPWNHSEQDSWETLHRARPADLSRLHQAGTPIELLTLLERMLSKQPLRRPSFNEVAERLLDLEIEHFGRNRQAA